MTSIICGTCGSLHRTRSAYVEHIYRNLECRRWYREPRNYVTPKDFREELLMRDDENVYIQGTDSPDVVLASLTAYFEEVIKQDTIPRKDLVRKLRHWAKGAEGLSIVERLKMTEPDINVVIRHNEYGQWSVEIPKTGAKITGLPSAAAAEEMAKHIRTNPDLWVVGMK